MDKERNREKENGDEREDADAQAGKATGQEAR
jgi:hypothetical protein